MKLSIITVVLNDLEGLKRTILSTNEQRKFYSEIEHIIVDGASTDGTQDYLAQNSHLYNLHISEPDSGIYDAMNKGIKLATGEALLFLNAGDYFVGNVLQNLRSAPAFLQVKYKDILNRFRGRPIVSNRISISNCHQGIIFENRGILYDCSYKICADYKFFLDHGYDHKIEKIDSEGYIFFDAVGVSAKKIRERDREILEIRRKYFGNFKGFLYETVPLSKRLIRLIIRSTHEK